jgi:lysozyme family protein
VTTDSDDYIDKLIDSIIAVETDKYTDHPADRGGPTRYGVTLATLRNNGDPTATAASVMGLSRAKAVSIYKTQYIAPFLFMANRHPKPFKFVCSAAVQHGVGGATRILQRALGVSVDARIGPNTKSAALIADDTLLTKLIQHRCKFYGDILVRDKSQLVFAAGWFNRMAHDIDHL